MVSCRCSSPKSRSRLRPLPISSRDHLSCALVEGQDFAQDEHMDGPLRRCRLVAAAAYACAMGDRDGTTAVLNRAGSWRRPYGQHCRQVSGWPTIGPPWFLTAFDRPSLDFTLLVCRICLRASASLKLRRSQRSDREQAGHLRRKCLGLIEARPRSRTRRRYLILIRGAPLSGLVARGAHPSLAAPATARC